MGERCPGTDGAGELCGTISPAEWTQGPIAQPVEQRTHNPIRDNSKKQAQRTK